MDQESTPTKRAVFAARLPASNKITIPEDVREKLKLKEGEWIRVVVERLEE